MVLVHILMKKKNRIIRYWVGDSKYWKKYSNKKCRKELKNSNPIKEKSLYKKIFDYWWTLF